MMELWQIVLEKVLLPLAVALAFWFARKLIAAFVTRVRIELDEHDLGVAEEYIRAAVVWAEVQCANLSGPDKMAKVLEYLAAKGIEAGPVEVEYYLQLLKLDGGLPDVKGAK